MTNRWSDSCSATLILVSSPEVDANLFPLVPSPLSPLPADIRRYLSPRDRMHRPRRNRLMLSTLKARLEGSGTRNAKGKVKSSGKSKEKNKMKPKKPHSRTTLVGCVMGAREFLQDSLTKPCLRKTAIKLAELDPLVITYYCSPTPPSDSTTPNPSIIVSKVSNFSICVRRRVSANSM